MTLLPMVLFILGIIVLILAWKMGNYANSRSPEIIATLKGLAGVKRELSQVQRGIREAEARMEDHELRILRNENAQADLLSVIKASNTEVASEVKEIRDSFLAKNREPINPGNVDVSTPRALPGKYRWVLELHDQGWSVTEIAGHLAISKDAVNMVLSTSQRGGRS